MARRSTDVLAIGDRHVVQALRMIREEACAGLLPRDVSGRIPLSRVLLGAKFKAAVGRTLGQEIQRVRIERACDLLQTTELPIKLIAHRAGFRGVEYMTRQFRRWTGRTPAAYRRRGSPRG